MKIRSLVIIAILSLTIIVTFPINGTSGQSVQGERWAVLAACTGDPLAAPKDAQYMYYLLSEFYAFDSIYYLNVRTDFPGVNTTTTKENFRWAITQWLHNNSDADDLIFIFVVGHGGGYNAIKKSLSGGWVEVESDEGNETLECNITRVDGIDYPNGYDVNGDGDTDDWVGVDECICFDPDEKYWDDELATDLNTLDYSRLVFVRVGCADEEGNGGCFNGGLIDDISAPNRIIMSASNETYYCYADGDNDGFSEWPEAFIDALVGEDMYWTGSEWIHSGIEIHADLNGDGIVSLWEAWNYAWDNDDARLGGDETPWLDDNGNGLPTYVNGTDMLDPTDGELASETCLWGDIPTSPPYPPSKPSGPEEGWTDTTYNYSTSTRNFDKEDYNFNTIGSYILAGTYRYYTNYQTWYESGMRFINVDIRRRSTIISARLKLCAWSNESGTTVNTRIMGEATGNSATFTDLNNYNGRARTNTYVDWDNIPAWYKNTWYTSPDLKDIIQEIVNRRDWKSGNALSLFWADNGSTTGVVYCYRTATAYDYSAANASKLEITFRSGWRTLTKTYQVSAVSDDCRKDMMEREAPVRYQFFWGDGTTETTGWYASGETVTASHCWTSLGTYSVRVRAQDHDGYINDYWGGLSPILRVRINIPANLTVLAEDQYGNSLTTGYVYIDGQYSGRTGSTFVVSVGIHEVYVPDFWESEYKYVFQYWEDDNSTDNPRSILVWSGRTIKAIFYKRDWVSPTGHEDPQNKWMWEQRVYDEDLLTYAYYPFNGGGVDIWSTPLILTVDEIASDGFRVKWGKGATFDKIRVSVYKDGDWVQVYEGADNSFNKISFTQGNVSKAKVEIHLFFAGSTVYGLVHEFDFWEV